MYYNQDFKFVKFSTKFALFSNIFCVYVNGFHFYIWGRGWNITVYTVYFKKIITKRLT